MPEYCRIASFVLTSVQLSALSTFCSVALSPRLKSQELQENGRIRKLKFCDKKCFIISRKNGTDKATGKYPEGEQRFTTTDFGL